MKADAYTLFVSLLVRDVAVLCLQPLTDPPDPLDLELRTTMEAGHDEVEAILYLLHVGGVDVDLRLGARLRPDRRIASGSTCTDTKEDG
jgi:hypothetical protein